MRVVAAEELTERAAALGVCWSGADEDDAWRETIRVHLAAEGSILRRTLVDRVLRWHDVPDEDARRERIHEVIDALDGVGDALMGDGGLIGAAPVRAAIVGDSRVVLLLGGVPTSVLATALPQETILRGRVRQVMLRHHDRAGLTRAMTTLGGGVIEVAVWAGLDRAPPTLDAWWQTLASRRVEAAAGGDERDLAVFVVHGDRGRWRRPEGSDAALPRLERLRQPGGWYRYAWRTEEGAGALTGDEATRTMLAIEARAGVRRTVTATTTPGDVVTVSVPGRIPRAEYRYLLGVGDRLEPADGAARYAAPAETWPELGKMFFARLGMAVDESGVTA